MKISATIAAVSGITSMATSVSLVAEKAQEWQSFWGIIFGGCTLVIFGYATYKNQKRQDEKFEEWKKMNGNDED